MRSPHIISSLLLRRRIARTVTSAPEKNRSHNFSRCVEQPPLKLMKYVSAIVSSYWFNVCESTNHFNCFKLEWSIEDIVSMECENQFTSVESMHDCAIASEVKNSPAAKYRTRKKMIITVKCFVIFGLWTELHGRMVFRNPRTVETHENQTFIVDYGNDHKFIISGFSLEPNVAQRWGYFSV